MLKNILRPLSYLTIDHSEKRVVDWIYPLALSTLTVIAIFSLKVFGAVSIYSADGLVSRVVGLVQSLPGFYIAALAAIATFNKADIDMKMPSPAPKINISIRGKIEEIDLTRRRFLCLMFSFLAAESILIVVIAFFAESALIPVKNLLPKQLYTPTSLVFLFVFFTMFWQMIVATFWGLYYLGDRLHQPDS